MTPSEIITKPTDREQALLRELEQAYEQLTEITSRLLLANEVSEAALSVQDRTEIAAQFLGTAARGLEVRRAAMFLVERDGFSVGATHGLRPEVEEALGGSEGDIEACQAAITGRAHVVDQDLLAPDAIEAIAASPELGNGETAAETEEEEAEATDDEEQDAEAEEAVDAGEDEEEEEEEEEAEAEADASEDEEEETEGDEEEVAPTAPTFGLYLPVRLEEEAVAVLALGERAGNLLFRHEDLVFVEYLLRQFALTLHRSTLMEQIQERLEEQSALLKVSREITSTLDLDAVLRSVVNTTAVVLENDRTEIALTRGSKLLLKTVSGMTRLDPDQTEIFKLTTPLEYLRAHPHRLQIGAGDMEQAPRAAQDVFGEYFSSQQMRSFMALPLGDDQGVMGFLCLESRHESWDLEPAEGDTLSILAAQATVAIRNATLYSEIPLRGVSLPVSRLRSRIDALTRRGRMLGIGIAIAVLAGLVLPIVPDRAGGSAEVRPLRFQGARAVTEGVVTRALVTGGEAVRRGQPLAEMEDFDLAGRIADLRSRLEVARRELASARLAGDVPRWREAELRVSGLTASLAIEERRARGSTLVAPLDGQVLELDLAQRAGQHLDAGESFATIAALDAMAVDFEVPEEQIGRVRIGQPVAIKVMTFPTRTFRGRVIEVGWRGHQDPHGRAHFTVRAEIENAARLLRPGMTGVAKASLGNRAAGSMLLDPLVRAVQMAWP